MDSKTIKSVCNQIYHQYPAVDGCQPKIQTKPSSKQGGETNLLVFQGKATTADGKILPVTVRVTVNEQGKILKVVSSK